MTKLLQRAISQVRGLPLREQNVAAQSLLTFAAGVKRGTYKLSRAELNAINTSRKETRGGKLATKREVEAAYKHFRA